MKLYDAEEIIEDFHLPELPEAVDLDDESTVLDDCKYLVFFRQDGDNVVISDPVSRADAMAYCDREDTHGSGWFVGFNNCDYPYEAGEVY